MEYLQRALERIIPDHREIADSVVEPELFTPHFFAKAPLDKSLCMLVDGQEAGKVAFLVERSGGRRRQVMWMPIEAGQPSAVMANYVGSIAYVPAGEYYYNEEAKLRLAIAAAARGHVRMVNNELLMLLCAAGRRCDSRSRAPDEERLPAVIERLFDELRADGLAADALVVPENTQLDELRLTAAKGPDLTFHQSRLLGRLPEGQMVWSAPGLKRVIALDTRELGVSAAGPLRVLLGAHNQRNAYWIIVGRYLNAVVQKPRAVRWARWAPSSQEQ